MRIYADDMVYNPPGNQVILRKNYKDGVTACSGAGEQKAETNK